MKELDQLINVILTLRSENGCPWDREQTLQSMRHSIIEETYELVEALDLNETAGIEEELGDLMFLTLFLGILGEQEKRFTLQAVVEKVTAKLIRRHPHVFDQKEVEGVEEVLKNWESIKLSETKNQNRHSIFDGIPKELPELQKIHKMLQKLKRNQFPLREVDKETLKELFSKYLDAPSQSLLDEFLDNFLLYNEGLKTDISKSLGKMIINLKEIENTLKEKL